MNKIYYTLLLGFICLHAFGQENGIEVSVSKNLNDQRTELELQSIQSASKRLLDQYAASGTLIDPEQLRVTYSSIEEFKKLFSADATLITDFLSPMNKVSVADYIKQTRTYYERGGIPFELSEVLLVDASYNEDCDCFLTSIQLTKTLQHHFSDDSWINEEKPLLLEFKLEVERNSDEAKITSIQKAPKPIIPQFTQHTFSFLGGTSLFSGDVPNGVTINEPYTLGFSYQFIKPLPFLGKSISLVAGAQLKYGSINTEVQERASLVIDKNVIDNSVTRINFLTDGNETINSFSIEPQLGLDIQFMEKPRSQMGVAFIFSPRFSISASGNYVGALSYEETFNERVTVSNIINCGLRDFEGAEAIDANYNTGLYNAGMGFLVSPYYQFATTERTGFRLGLDVQYYISSMYQGGGRFLGNYNAANNPDTSGNPDLSISNATLLQTAGQELAGLYIGLRLGYYFAQ